MNDYLYHIVANVDTIYDDEAQCRKAFFEADGVTPKICAPYIPLSASCNEDTHQPRIPVAKSLEDCVTSMGVLGRFRRCLAANDDAKSYEDGGPRFEAYPVVVMVFPGDTHVIQPTKDQVPDAEETGELWIPRLTKPLSVEIKWLGSFSILYEEPEDDDLETHPVKCTSIEFLDDLANAVHPWLTGTGNILESSLMDYEWYESKYRTPPTVLESVMLHHAVRNNSNSEALLRAMTELFPYRSRQELWDIYHDEYKPDGEWSQVSAEIKLRLTDPRLAYGYVTTNADVHDTLEDSDLWFFHIGEKETIVPDAADSHSVYVTFHVDVPMATTERNTKMFLYGLVKKIAAVLYEENLITMTRVNIHVY